MVIFEGLNFCRKLIGEETKFEFEYFGAKIYFALKNIYAFKGQLPTQIYSRLYIDADIYIWCVTYI